MKRTTGIPRSFLQKVDKSVVLAQSEGDESKRPSGIMVNAEGDFVIAEPDKASWEKFQAKAKTSSAAKEGSTEDREIQERGLECSIDKKMFIEPMKTPCCQKTFCNDCITNALIESDFVCPACQTEGVLIDDLQADEESTKKIQEYLKEKESAKPASPAPAADEKAEVEGGEKLKETTSDQAAEKTEPSPTEEAKKPESKPEEASQNAKPKLSSSPPTKSQSPPAGLKSAIPGSQAMEPAKSQDSKAGESNPKKRPADGFSENPKIPKGPKAMQSQQTPNQMNNNMMNGMPNMGMNNMMFNGMPNMMPNMMGMPNMNMNMGMPNMMGMPMMGMPGFQGMNGMNGMNGNFGGMNGWDMGGMGGPGMNPMGNFNMNGGFPSQGNFPPNANDEDAYFRKPVNPHRHQNKQRRVRPSDYREL